MESEKLIELCIWREARSAARDARLGVLSVLRNRLEQHWLGATTLAEVVLRKRQFSSFNWDDPNSNLWPRQGNAADWEAWLDICSLVNSDPGDNTNRANSYHNLSMTPFPKWADQTKLTVDLGPFRFYKL